MQWDGSTWRQGPRRLNYEREILPHLQSGDCLKLKKLKRKSTRKNLILKKRQHAKDLFLNLEKVLENHFGENVFFSEKKLQISMENMGWNEDLKVLDLGCDDAEHKGTIEFNIVFTIKNE